MEGRARLGALERIAVVCLVDQIFEVAGAVLAVLAVLLLAGALAIGRRASEADLTPEIGAALLLRPAKRPIEVAAQHALGGQAVPYRQAVACERVVDAGLALERAKPGRRNADPGDGVGAALVVSLACERLGPYAAEQPGQTAEQQRCGSQAHARTLAQKGRRAKRWTARKSATAPLPHGASACVAGMRWFLVEPTGVP